MRLMKQIGKRKWLEVVARTHNHNSAFAKIQSEMRAKGINEFTVCPMHEGEYKGREEVDWETQMVIVIKV